jgi:uncharacterized protein YkwD
MLKSILSICIMGAFGMLIVAFVQPTLATKVVDRVLGTFIADSTAETLPNMFPNIIDGNVINIENKPLLSFLDSNKRRGTQTPLDIESIIDATNNERVKAGLLPLAVNTKLNASAKIKVEDMINRQYFEHAAPTGENVSDLGQRVEYNYVIMGENLAMGNFISAEDLVKAWMDSPGHRENIMSLNYQDIGVFAMKGMYQGREVWFAVQHFGTTRNACPVINQTLKNSIDTLNASLKKRDAQISALRIKIEAEDHPDGDEYRRMIAEFNRLVKEYNTELAASQKLITQYNAQVVAFNNCLAQYQKQS